MMPDAPHQQLDLHQLLHGYSGGHRLLASSCSLSKGAQRRTRMMSDLSGASTPSGFDGYLTGYPIEEDGLYAFARTWYATTQPRPGCVWTHTLLIPFDEIERFDELGAVLAAFVRPDLGEYSAYERPLTVSECGPRSSVQSPRDFIKEVISTLYSEPDQVVAIAAGDSQTHEALILSIWSQQWGSLRKRFSFSTGSLDLRSGEDRLDLQVIPNEKRLVEKARTTACVVVAGGGPHRNACRWASVAVEDLVEGGRAEFRSFLGRFADPSHEVRSYFRRYAECFLAVTTTDDVANAARRIAAEFPVDAEAPQLKTALCGPPERRTYFLSTSEADILRALSQADVGFAYDMSCLGIVERFERMWEANEEDAWELATQLWGNCEDPLTRCLSEAIARKVSKDGVARIASERCDVTVDIVRRNTAHAVVSEVWGCGDLDLDALGDEFPRCAASCEEFPRQVVTAWIVSGREDCGRELEASIDSSLVPLLLGLDRSTLSLMDRQSGAWSSLLRKHQQACVDWLLFSGSSSPEAACLATTAVSPNDTAAGCQLLAQWEAALVERPDLTQRTLCHAFTTMLAVSFECPRETASEAIVRACFPFVYTLALQNELPERYWESISTRLPQSGLWWDKCKKLRMGLLHYCVANGWTAETFVRSTACGYAFEQVLGSWGLHQDEKEYLSSVISAVNSGMRGASHEQQRAAERYARWF